MPDLKNTYYVLRHGQSEANVSRLISSDPKRALNGDGLTKVGKRQVAESVQAAIAKGWLDSRTLIYSSDFKRTLETAKIAKTMLHAGRVHIRPALRERSFGELEGKEHKRNYLKVWARDKNDPTHNKYGVESINEMTGRVMSLLRELDGQHKEKVILLVSHGDPLYVLLAAAAGTKPTKRRLLRRLKTAEIRPLLS